MNTHTAGSQPSARILVEAERRVASGMLRIMFPEALAKSFVDSLLTESDETICQFLDDPPNTTEA
jgi:hypothetical protein